MDTREILSSLTNLLVQYSHDSLPIDDLFDFCAEHGDFLAQFLDKHVMLQIRLRDARAIPALSKRFLLQGCNCESVFSEGVFSDSVAYKTCRARIECSAFLHNVPMPEFCSAGAPEIGAVAVYRCQKCNALWRLRDPERSNRGSWVRVF